MLCEERVKCTSPKLHLEANGTCCPNSVVALTVVFGGGCWGIAEHNGRSAKRTVRDRQAHFSRCSFLTQTEEARINRLSSQIVAMMKTAEPGHADNLGAYICIFCRLMACWSLLVQTKVRSVRVVVTNVLGH